MTGDVSSAHGDAETGLGRSMVLVTGAAGHLGRAIVWGLARDGALPVLTGRNEGPLAVLADALTIEGFPSMVAPCDIGDTPAVTALLDRLSAEAIARGRDFDGVVNNAFAGKASDADSDPVKLFSEAAGINLGAAAHITQYFAGLPGTHPKSVVNIASIYGIVSPDPTLYPAGVAINPAHYGATKAGMIQLTRTMAVALAPHGTRVNAVIPGAFPNDDVCRGNPEFVGRLAARNPMKRIGSAPEVYPPIRFFLRRDASFVTGASLAVDGGWTSI